MNTQELTGARILACPFTTANVSPRDEQNLPVGSPTFMATIGDMALPVGQRLRWMIFAVLAFAGAAYGVGPLFHALFGSDPIPGICIMEHWTDSPAWMVDLLRSFPMWFRAPYPDNLFIVVMLMVPVGIFAGLFCQILCVLACANWLIVRSINRLRMQAPNP